MRSVIPNAEVTRQAEQHFAAHQQKLLQAFHGQIYLTDTMDVQVGRLWDSIDVERTGAFTSANSILFTNVESCSGKTYPDTNLTRNGCLEPPESFTFNRIVFTFNRDASPDDLYAIAERFTWRFWKGKKYYLSGVMIAMQMRETAVAPFRICEFCRSVYVQDIQCPGCGARQFQLSDIGEPQISGHQFFMDVPDWMPIVNQMSFMVDFTGSSYIVKHRIKLWCHLEGLHARGVS